MVLQASASLSVETLTAIDGLCAAFEKVWRSGARPRIDDYLPCIEERARPVLLVELIRIEVDWRRRAGEPVEVQEYVQRYPEHRAHLDTWLGEGRTGAFSNQESRSETPSSGEPGGSATGASPPVADPPDSPDLGFLEPARAAGELGRLGEHRILRVLGHGGMGLVLLAEDPGLQRQVAVKVMLPECARGESSRQRFLREGRAMAALKSDHVVTVHQVGQVGDVPFLAMELLQGETLAARLKRGGQLPWREVVQVGLETAEGLAAAHECGLIHRDVKPANLWLEDRASKGVRVKVLDFGLAHAADGQDQLTQSGTVMGTAGYMAPEQADGQPVDSRADLFSLGCVLYHAATGRQPFTGPSVRAILKKVLLDQPPPPARVCSELPVALSELIEQLLAKEPHQRPASARAVIAALQAILRTQPPPLPALDSQGTTQSYHAPMSDTPPILPGTATDLSLRSRTPARGVIPLVPALLGLVVLLGGFLAWYLIPRSPAGPRTGEEAIAPATPVVAEQPLSGELIVSVWTADRTKNGFRIGSDPRAVPVREDELLHLEATLNQPAYVYLLWVDGKGQVTPLYPWNGETGNKIVHRTLAAAPPAQEPRAVVQNPRQEYGFWAVDDTIGLDTILLLARKTPLPADVRLAEVVGKVPPAPLGPLGEVVVRGLDHSRSAEEAMLEQDRAPKEQAVLIDNQLLDLMTKLKEHFALIRAVQLAHVGK